MDLRQFLIVPHERSPQRSHVLHQHDFTTGDLDSRLTRYAPMAPVAMRRHKPIETHVTYSQGQLNNQDARSCDPYQQPTVAQQQSQQPQEQIITREQVIRGLATYPDILAAILRSGQLPIQTEHDSSLQRQKSFTTASSQQPDTSTLAPTPTAPSSSTSTPQAAQSTPSSTKLCFWQYHYGDCTSNPCSPNYNGGRPCEFVHSTDSIDEHSRLQKWNIQWHKHLGDCGLGLCRFSSNHKFRAKAAIKESKKKTKVSATKALLVPSSAADQVLNRADNGGYVQHKITDLGDEQADQSTAANHLAIEQDTTTAGKLIHIPTSPRAGRHAKGQRLQLNPITSPLPPPSTKKRNSCTQPPHHHTSPPPKKQKPNPVSFSQKSKSHKTAVTPTLYSVTSSTTSSPKLPVLGASAIKNKKKQFVTCFYWYHGNCSKKGRNCEKLHALTQPPSFVQPPRGYVHEVEDKVEQGGEGQEGYEEQQGGCFRDWCPGDWMWGHGDESGEVEDEGMNEEVEDGESDEEIEGDGMILGVEEEETR